MCKVISFWNKQNQNPEVIVKQDKKLLQIFYLNSVNQLYFFFKDTLFLNISFIKTINIRMADTEIKDPTDAI